jgi:hypothetical protein
MNDALNDWRSPDALLFTEAPERQHPMMAIRHRTEPLQAFQRQVKDQAKAV